MVVVIGDSNAMISGLISAFGAVIGAPVVYGCAGFIAGLLLAASYNMAARFTGGIKMKFDS